VDTLRVRYAVVNEGPTLKRFTMAAMGRGTPIKKRTSHVEIRVGADVVKGKPAPKAANPAAAPRGKGEAPKAKAAPKAEAKAAAPAAKKPRAKKEK
jgi:large subunit ribosomal protein L22